VNKVKKVRMFATLFLLGAFVGGILFIPFPSSVLCNFELQPHGAASVYVEVEGTLEELLVESGDQVKAGDTLARLGNIELEIEIQRLQGQRNATVAQLHSLQEVRFRDGRRGSQINVVREQLVALEEQLQMKQHDMNRLELVAPISGTVISPPQRDDLRSDQQVELASWSGSLLEEKNLGATLLPDGQHNLFCKIGDPNQWDAVLVINQREQDLVAEGQEVRLMFAESTNHVFVSTIDYFAFDELESLSPRLASTSGGPIPAQAERDGTVRPLNTSYQAVVRLDNARGLFRDGLIGQARIKTAPRTLASRLIRYLGRTFNFDL